MKWAKGELTQVLHERCRCGRDKTHARIRPNCSYDAWGVFGLVFGSWGTPRYVEFTCPDCQCVLERTRDRAVRVRYK